jgi:phage-related protein
VAGPTVVVSVLADSANMRKGFAEINDSAGKVGGGLSTLAKIGGAALLAVGAAVAGVVASSIKAAADAQVVAAQTTAVLASTAHSANRTADEIGKLASSLSQLSGVDDEVIQSGQNLLLTFTNIQGINFDRATAAALDLSVAMGTDMSSAAQLVGKALNDPIKGMSALSRVGVQLSADQKSVIESLVATGDVAGAQAVILEELNRQFGGSAEAFGNTFEGALGKVQTNIGNLQEIIGSAFLPPLTAVLNTVAGVLNSVAESPAFNTIVNTIGEFVTSLLSGEGAAAGLGDAFRVVMAVLNPFGLVLQALVPVLPTLGQAFMQLGQALGGALVQVLPVLVGLIDSLVAALSGVLAAVLPIIVGLITQLVGIFTRLLPVILPVINQLAGILTDALTQLVPIIAVVAETIGGILGAALTAIEPLLTMLFEVLAQVLEALAPLIPAVLSIVEAFLPLLPVFGELIGALLPPLVELLMAVLGPILALISPLLDLLVPALQFVADVLGAVIGVIAEVIGAFVGLVTGSQDAQAKVKGVWQGVLDFFASIPRKIGEFFAGAVNWLRDAGKNIVQGLMNGLASMAGQVGKFFLNLLPGWIVGPFKAALGIASPSRLFEQFGRFIPQGLVRGVASGIAAVTSVSGAMADAVIGGFGSPSASFEPGAYAGRAGGGNSYTIQLPVGMPSAEAGRAIVDAIDEYERLNGKRP